MCPDAPYLSFYSVKCQTILLVTWRVLVLNGLNREDKGVPYRGNLGGWGYFSISSNNIVPCLLNMQYISMYTLTVKTSLLILADTDHDWTSFKTILTTFYLCKINSQLVFFHCTTIKLILCITCIIFIVINNSCSTKTF